MNEFTDGTVEMGVVTKAAFSTNTTLTVQVPEGYALPTSGGVASLSYSSQKLPYGFPADKGKWRILLTSVNVATTTAIGATAQWYVSVFRLTIPLGAWLVGYSGGFQKSTNVAGPQTAYFLLAPATPTNAVYSYPLLSSLYNGASVAAALAHIEKSDYVTLTAATEYLLYGATPTATGTENWIVNGTIEPLNIFADCAYV